MRWAVAALCALWFGCSALGNVVGKLLLQEFPWPATVALAQLLGAALLCSLLLARERPPPARAAPPLRALLPLAGAKFLTALCSQLSLWTVPVSYAHTGERRSLGGAARAPRPAGRAGSRSRSRPMTFQ